MAELYALHGDRAATGELLAWTWEQGAAGMVLPEGASEVEVRRLLDLLAPTALVEMGSDGRPHLLRLTQTAPVDDEVAPVADEVALVVTTSGSSGEPKGVELTHAALETSVTASLRRLSARPGERWGLALPTHHVAGISVHLRAAALGTRAVVAADTAAVGHLDVEHVALVPTQLERLLDLGAPVERFATILLGGARAPRSLLARAAAAGARVVRSYGMTETVGGCVYDGVPFPDVEVALTGPQRLIALRGPVLLHGYRTRDERGRLGSVPALDEDGWFHTRDRGRMDDGLLEVTGREDEVLVSGGENVPLAAVRERLLTHPGIADAAVVPIDDDRWGQVPVAVVVPADPDRPPSLAEVRHHVRREAPAAYAPARVVVVSHLPRDGMGKLVREALERLVRTDGTS